MKVPRSSFLEALYYMPICYLVQCAPKLRIWNTSPLYGSLHQAPGLRTLSVCELDGFNGVFVSQNKYIILCKLLVLAYYS